MCIRDRVWGVHRDRAPLLHSFHKQGFLLLIVFYNLDNYMVTYLLHFFYKHNILFNNIKYVFNKIYFYFNFMFTVLFLEFLNKSFNNDKRIAKLIIFVKKR